ncbi:hypothetical protein [Actinomadura luzonensis]|uniref:hypothetical protein n=1 Tax=Actinomadura luzonensis TaxID=2805427 RepID=UPI0026752287|nr:hypothetical protein [Actinomadura luzonensis]
MRRTLLTTALLAGLAALAAGCGGQSGGPGVASVAGASAPPPASASPSATADPQEQGRLFARCMREHGVPMDDPDTKDGGLVKIIGEGLDKNTIKQATDACRQYAPSLDRKSLDPQQVEQLRQFARCMREHGVNMPDPDPDGGFASGTARAFKPDDPAFKKAFEACRDTFPRIGGGK